MVFPHRHSLFSLLKYQDAIKIKLTIFAAEFLPIMKILQLCKKVPYPLKDGESVAVTYLSKALHQLGCQLDLLAMNTVKHYINPDDIPEDFNHYRKVAFSKLDNRIKAKDALLNLFTKDSYHVVRYISDDYTQKLIQLLQTESYDIVQLETLYLAPYIPIIRQHSQAKIVMRSHNVESEIWERIARNTSFGLKKWYVNLLAKRLKNFELDHLNKYDVMVAITERDWAQFRQMGCNIAGHAAPIGLEMADYPKHPLDADIFSTKGESMPPSLCFIGSLDWMPNTEGLTWFLDNIWLDIYHQYPDITLHIAGRNTPDWLHQKKIPNIVIHGEIEDALAFITDHPIMIVPLFSGSGMRVKILESMALSRVTITTTIGLEGIHAQAGQEVLIADNKDDFIRQIQFCIDNSEQLPIIGNKARTFIEQHFDNISIAKRLLDFYHEIL